MSAVFSGIRGGRRVVTAIAIVLSAMVVLGVGPVRSARADERYGRRLQMLALTNHDRHAHDRDSLGFAASLSRYAKEHSREMARRGYLFHSSDEQLQSALGHYAWSIGGENVGVGGSLDGLEEAFMASKDHRENILRPTFDHAAVGVVRADGRIWVTVIFYG
jgi:uncharacterized protein YkwD